MKSLLLVALSILSLNVFATSGGVGNGGDVIVCQNQVTLLDSYEATKLGLELDLNPTNISEPTWRSMINVAVERLAKKDKYTAKKIYEYSMEMVSDLEMFRTFPSTTNRYRGRSLYLGPDSVGEISDSGHRTVPAGCEIRQLVSQINPTRSRENRYEMNLLLWNKLSLLDQSMTILHEAWYRLFLEDGAKDSRGARYMNALVASTDFEGTLFSEYLQDLRSTEKKYYVIENKSTLVFDKEFKVELKQAKLNFQDTKVCTESLDVKANIKQVAQITNMHFGIAKIKFTDVCFNNSVIESLTLPEKFSGKRINFVMENYLVRTNGNLGNHGVIRFNKNGTFRTVENLELEKLYKLFYKCGRGRNRIDTFEKKDGCRGPYLHKDSAITQLTDVIFDNTETPIGYVFPTEVK